MKYNSSFLAWLMAGFLLAFVHLNGFAQYTIQGNVLYHNNPNKPIPNVEVTLSNPSGSFTLTTYTNNQGFYSFMNVPAGTYQLSASTNIPAGGVNLQDSYLILLHILGIYNFTPIQELAADVTGDGQVNMDDYFTVVFGWFLYGYPFPIGTWVFEEAAITAGLKEGNTSIGGSSSADVNGTFSPNITKLDEIVAIETDQNIQISENEYATIPIYLKNSENLEGFALYLEYPSEGIQVEGIESQLDGLNYYVTDNEIRVVWNDATVKGKAIQAEAPLFNINIKTLPGFKDLNSVRFNPIYGSHAIKADGNLAELKLGSIEMNYVNPSNEIFSIFPNPINRNTIAKINLNQNGKAKLEIFNTEGKIMNVPFDNFFSEGIHTIPLGDLPMGKGIYLYRLTIQYDKTIKTLQGKILK